MCKDLDRLELLCTPCEVVNWHTLKSNIALLKSEYESLCLSNLTSSLYHIEVCID